MSEALLRDVIEELWASFGYGSPEAHAPILIKMISKGLIDEFLDDLNDLSMSIGEWGDGILVASLIEKWEARRK